MCIGVSYTSKVEMADSLNDDMLEFAYWNEEIISEFENNYISPTMIKSSGQNIDGKMIVRYFKTATTKDGETVEVDIEKVFDFILDKGMDF